jgi:hypothetical protein
MHGRPGKKASEAPCGEIMYHETDDNILGEHVGTILAPVYVLHRHCAFFFLHESDDIDNTMDDDNNREAAVVAVYLPLVRVLVLIPFSYLLDLLSLIYMLKFASMTHTEIG